MDIQYHIIGVFEASHGSVCASMFPIREIMQKSLMIGAVNIVLVHNHPSGDPEPSTADIESTKQLVQAGKIIGINVADHVIIASTGEYYSFSQERRI